MTKIDQFESVFKAAVKTVFQYQEITLTSGLVVTDLDENAASAFGERVRGFVQNVGLPAGMTWRDLHGGQFRNAEDLLELVEQESPDLVCTYRTLHSSTWKWRHSLGEHIDVLTQVARPPVLLLPHPDSGEVLETALTRRSDKGRSVVMAMTDHLTGDHRLVNFALLFTGPEGELHLANVEGRATFERYMDAISKIPSIDTDDARESILKQLLKEPHDYIASCKKTCEDHDIAVTIEATVVVGEHLAEYKRLIEARGVQLLVVNTKDEEQLAMHGLAYPLAVELTHVPMLLL